MSVHVDAVEGLGGVNPSRVAAEAPLTPGRSPTHDRVAKRGLRRFLGHRLGTLATAALFALGLGVTSADKPSNPDSTDASKIPPAPSVMVDRPAPSELQHLLTKEEQFFVDTMSSFLDPETMTRIKDLFTSSKVSPKQFSVTDTPAGKGYIFQFPESSSVKPDIAIVDLFLDSKTGSLKWNAQTENPATPDFPNQKAVSLAHSERELIQKANSYLSERYQSLLSKKPLFYSDQYFYNVGFRISTSDGGEEWGGASIVKSPEIIIPSVIHLGGGVTPPHSSEWRLDPPKASMTPDPLQRVPR